MADLRIYELADSQVAYDPDIELAVDDSGFTNTKKMPVSAIFPKTNTLGAAGDYNPATTLLRADNGSGAESKFTVEDMLSDSDTVTILKALIEEKVDWVTASNVYGSITTGILRACSLNKVIHISVTLDYNVAPSEDVVIFTLPGTFALFTEEVQISLVGQSSQITNLKSKVGTRDIISGTYSSDGLMFGSASIPVI